MTNPAQIRVDDNEPSELRHVVPMGAVDPVFMDADNLPPDEALPHTAAELVDDPRFNDPNGFAPGTWRDSEGRDLYGALVADRGSARASFMWKAACAMVDHIGTVHGSGPCDC